MKKVLIVLIILIIPAAAFAQLQIGPTAFYNFPLIGDSTLNPPELSGLNISDFSFGVDIRGKIAFFQLSGMALFTPGVSAAGGSITLPASTDIFLDAGVAFDIAIIRLGLGVGPNFTFFFGEGTASSDIVSAGMNIKATLEFLLGKVAIGITYLTQFDFDLQQIGSVLSADKTQGLFGLSVLFTL
jgi:hypothetical protein